MKNALFAGLVLALVAGFAIASQDTDITNRQVRDPLQLESYLEANATDAETRLAAVETGAQGATALSVTNGQAITVADSVYVLSGIGGADNTTNTVTLVAPSAAGQSVVLLVATASSNLVTIADSGTVAASGAILLDGNDSAFLVSVDTSTWVLVSESDN